MYNSNGNYEAFANPKKPARTDEIKDVYLVGSGLASLAAAAFMIRDAKFPGEKIHIFEELPLSGGSLDGRYMEHRGWVVRGGREMENHFECLWDLFRSIPSIENKEYSVLDEFYWLNKQYPNSSHCRLIENRGQRKADDGKYVLSMKSIQEIVKLVLTDEKDLQDVAINDVFSEEFFASNFWWYWQTMFAFEDWASAMEMRRYLMRFIHHVDGLADFTALKFTNYNQYESLVLPLVNYLKANNVSFEYETRVDDIIVDSKSKDKTASKIELTRAGKKETINLTKDDLVFVTNGSITESSTYGDQNTPAPKTKALGGSWNLWKSLAEQDKAFGKPEKFYDTIKENSWFISATMTLTDDEVIPYMEKISKRVPKPHQPVTGGIVTAIDSNWELSYTMNRQPHFIKQEDGTYVVWFYALLSGIEGNYIKKPVEDCTGKEIAQEWLWHMGVPEDKIEDLSTNHMITVPVYMPYITSYFQPRALGDRPYFIPEGYTNLACIGNFAEIERDTVFTTEYSVRTAMSAVYQLFQVDRGVPEVFASAFDLRTLAKAAYWLTDQKDISEMDLPFMDKQLAKILSKKVENNFIGEFLTAEHLLKPKTKK
ncbi:oleate hydratase [Mesoplasma lactucae]|uniref:Oleate hydratase n=1 Tax=Mesoplasma lactucae ATCC 49193 TaxID=81460 RepID=A0A291IRR9_9MOLU|nr:oleate hydratase [Mesoplasma lactucae]ATG97625.1 oleate hydratase [Mesoplasma lactucae ATCC 49193]ATZ19914.1 oleate hydratase [Mesoplasma lactucae ATCC 49193]MCL8216778.1 Oleate hydratase [Mesoplasma lactucae ATCC 49193]